MALTILALLTGFVAGVFSSLLYNWNKKNVKIFADPLDKDTLIKTLENGVVDSIKYGRPKKIKLNRREDDVEMTFYEWDDDDDFFYPTYKYILKWSDIKALIKGNGIRMQYGDYITWHPSHNVRLSESKAENTTLVMT